MSALLTHSRLKTARKCARLHFYQYIEGYRPTDDRAELAFGTVVHRGLEAWWRAVKDGAAKDTWLGLALNVVSAVAGLDAYALAMAEVLLASYHARWADDADGFEVLGVEEQFDIPLVNPETGRPSPLWRVAGKLDVRVRRRADGTVGIIEHKTSGEDIGPGSSYWARLAMDPQVSVYFDGAASLGPAPEWCLYDVLGKPGQRPSQVPLLDEHGNKIVLDAKGDRVKTQQGKWRQTGDAVQGFVLQTREETPAEYRARLVEAVATDPDRYLKRGDVVRLEAELRDARAETWAQAGTLRENANANRHARNPDACNAFGKTCPFFGVCTGADSLSNERLFTRTSNVHPELAGHPSSEAGPKEVAHA